MLTLRVSVGTCGCNLTPFLFRLTGNVYEVSQHDVSPPWISASEYNVTFKAESQFNIPLQALITLAWAGFNMRIFMVFISEVHFQSISSHIFAAAACCCSLSRWHQKQSVQWLVGYSFLHWNIRLREEHSRCGEALLYVIFGSFYTPQVFVTALKSESLTEALGLSYIRDLRIFYKHSHPKKCAIHMHVRLRTDAAAGHLDRFNLSHVRRKSASVCFGNCCFRMINPSPSEDGKPLWATDAVNKCISHLRCAVDITVYVTAALLWVLDAVQ